MDQSTGAATLIGPFGAGIGFAWALDYDVETGRIYGVDDYLNLLFWADTITGAATVQALLGRGNISDIAFDWETNMLYGIDFLRPQDYFFTVDKTTGATTNIGPMGEPIIVKGLAKPISEQSDLDGTGYLMLMITAL